MHSHKVDDRLRSPHPGAGGGTGRAGFTPAELIGAAVAAAGVGGDGAILDTPALHALCTALAAGEADFNFIGRARARKLLVETLVKRLRVAYHMEHSPEIGALALASPIVLAAPFRSGTTLLHRLIALDPAHRAPRLWETLQAPPLEPAYRGDPRYFELDYRVEVARRYMETRARMSGDIAAMHPSGADLPEECFGLLETSLMSHSFMFYGPVPAYLEWLREAGDDDWRSAYALYADQLRLLQWWAPGERWVLKTPFHIWAVDALRSALPDALIVQQHRSPATVVASFCSLTAAAYRPIVNTLDLHAIGRTALNYLREALARDMAARRRLGPERIIDIGFQELMADPMACVERIYAAVDARLGGEAERRMREWLAEQRRSHRPDGHRYDLADYGLDRDEVEEAFAEYDACCEAI